MLGGIRGTRPRHCRGVPARPHLQPTVGPVASHAAVPAVHRSPETRASLLGLRAASQLPGMPPAWLTPCLRGFVLAGRMIDMPKAVPLKFRRNVVGGARYGWLRR